MKYQGEEGETSMLTSFSTVVTMNETTKQPVYNIDPPRESEDCCTQGRQGTLCSQSAGTEKVHQPGDRGPWKYPGRAARWKHSQFFLSFLMKNLHFLHCGRANGTVTYDSQFMSFATSIMFLAGSELYCAQFHGEKLQRQGEALGPLHP